MRSPSLYLTGAEVPGLSTHERDDSLSLTDALRTHDAQGDAIPDEKRARALSAVAQDWFDRARWYVRESTICTAFYNGWQYGVWSDAQTRYITVPVARSNAMVRIVVNAIKPVVDAATGILCRDQPIFGAAGAKSEVRDSAASEAADAVLRDVWRQHQLLQMYRTSAREAYISGTCPILVEWDTGAGRPLPAMDDVTILGQTIQVPRMAADGSPEMTREGMLRFTILDNAQVAPDPSASNDQQSEGTIIVERMSMHAAVERYGEIARKLEGGSAAPQSSQNADYDYAVQADRASVATVGQVTPARRVEDTVTVYRAFARSSSAFPLGREVHFGGAVIVWEGDNPVYPRPDEPDETWPRISNPVIFVRCDERKSSVWGSGRVVHMLEPQRTYNGCFSKAVQHIAAMAPKLVKPAGLEAQWSDEVAQFIPTPRWMQPNQIYYLQPPALSNVYPIMLDRLRAELENIGGINEATMGEAPSADSSGRQVSLLQQANLGRLKPVKSWIDLTWGEAMRYALFLWNRHADTKRKILVIGENKEVEVKYLSRADLAAGTDVIIFNDQSLPSDPSARILALNQIFQGLQAIQDPRHKVLFLRLHRLHDFAGTLEKINPDEVKANRMIRLMLDGQPWYSNPADDPLTMKQELDAFIKTREFEMIVEREKRDSGGSGFSRTEQYVLSAQSYFTMVGAGQAQVQEGGFVMPPAAPEPIVPAGVVPPAPLPAPPPPEDFADEPTPGPSGDVPGFDTGSTPEPIPAAGGIA